MPLVSCPSGLNLAKCDNLISPANTVHSTNARLMLGQPNINPALAECTMFAGRLRPVAACHGVHRSNNSGYFGGLPIAEGLFFNCVQRIKYA